MSPYSSDYIFPENPLFSKSGARGQIIVGTHCLVSTPSKALKPALAWLGIVSKESFTEFTQYGQLY